MVEGGDAARRRLGADGALTIAGSEQLARKTPAAKKPRRKRRSKPDAQKKTPIKDDNVNRALATLLQSTLILQQPMRMVVEILLDTFLIPAASKVAVKIIAEQKGFGAEVLRRRAAAQQGEGNMEVDGGPKVLPLGPPSCSLALARSDGLAEGDCGSQRLKAMTEMAAAFAKLSRSELMDVISECRLTRTAKPAVMKLQAGICKGYERKALLAALVSVEGFQRCDGSAPAGYLEEELQDWLEVISGKQVFATGLLAIVLRSLAAAPLLLRSLPSRSRIRCSPPCRRETWTKLL